jgi:hypothetical protein
MFRYCFSLYSNELKDHFGYTQEEIPGIGSANNLGIFAPASCLVPGAAERLSEVPFPFACYFAASQTHKPGLTIQASLSNP